MKKYFLLLLIPVFVASCGREAKKKAEELQARTDSLMTQTMQKDEAINEFRIAPKRSPSRGEPKGERQ